MGLIGAVVVIEVSLIMVKVAGRPPKVTVVAPVNPVPVIVTAVEPSAAPIEVESELTTGVHSPVVYVNPLLNVVVPEALVTAIAAAPEPPAGVTNVSCESDITLTLVAVTLWTVTPVVPVKFDPVSVTVVPPLVVPLTGASELIVGVTLNERA